MISLTIITISAALRSLAEIAKWRPRWTWVPKTWLDYRGPVNVDLYHVCANYWVVWAAALALQIPLEVNTVYLLADLALVWLIHGIINDLFYHIIWMKTGHRDWKNIWIIKIFTIWR